MALEQGVKGAGGNGGGRGGEGCGGDGGACWRRTVMEDMDGEKSKVVRERVVCMMLI